MVEINNLKLDVNQFKNIWKNLDKNNSGLSLLDLRTREEGTEKGIIPGSILIPLNAPLERFSCVMVSPYSNLLVVTSEKDFSETLKRLTQLSYNKILGHINFEDWEKAGESTVKLKNIYDLKEVETLIDVREPWEWKEVGCSDFENQLFIRMMWFDYYWRKLDQNKVYSIICASGMRSYIVSTFLMSKGFKVNNYFGGVKAIKDSGKDLVSKDPEIQI